MVAGKVNGRFLLDKQPNPVNIALVKPLYNSKSSDVSMSTPANQGQTPHPTTNPLTQFSKARVLL